MASHPSIDHHRKAAEHHRKAADQHELAAQSLDKGNQETAAHHAHLAHGHHIQATDHMNAAAKKQSEQTAPAKV